MLLRDLCSDYKKDIVDGPFGANLKREHFISEGVPVLKIQNIKPFKIVMKKMDYVSNEKASELQRHAYKNGDIIITKLGLPLGVSAIVEDIENGLIIADLVRVRASKIDTKYLCYHLNSPLTSEYLNEQSTGATRPRVKITAVRDLPIFAPPLPEQKRIVAILDEAFVGIDAAVANTEKNLANARKLFESYLNALSFEKKSLGSLVEIKTGKLNANAAVEGGEYPFFTCSREVYEIDHYAFDCEAILLAGNNASGDFNVKHYNGKFNAYQRTYIITINGSEKLRYRFLYFQLLKSLKELKSSSVGAGTKFLKLDMIKNLQIALPPIKEQQLILETLEGLLYKSQQLETIYQKKLSSLTELKQSILQKAFAGELTALPEKALEEAVA